LCRIDQSPSEHHVVAVQTDHILCKEVSLAVILLTPNSLKQTLAPCKSKCVVRYFPEMGQICYLLWTSHNKKLSVSASGRLRPQTTVIGSRYRARHAPAPPEMKSCVRPWLGCQIPCIPRFRRLRVPLYPYSNQIQRSP